jgi:UV DNA damage repair endonuclease
MSSGKTVEQLQERIDELKRVIQGLEYEMEKKMLENGDKTFSAEYFLGKIVHDLSNAEYEFVLDCEDLYIAYNGIIEAAK